MTWEFHRHDARRVSEIIAPESVDAIITSPPYFALRSYRDECEACGGTGRLPTFDYDTTDPDGTCFVCNGSGRSHFDGQLGSEATPGEFVDNLIACTADWLKVLKPAGSLFVNLSDKFAGSGGHNNSNITGPSAKSTLRGNGHVGGGPKIKATTRNAPDRYNQASDGIPPKSRMALPWRYAIRCIDELGLILRADIIWSKPNGLPESVTDRVRMSHEYLFHFTRQGRYFAAIDEVREEHHRGPSTHAQGRDGSWTAAPVPGGKHMESGQGVEHRAFDKEDTYLNPLGKAPGSVWQIPSEPLQVPDHVGVDHFAAYPSELVRRCVLGWTPSGWCTVCGEARRPVVDKALNVRNRNVVPDRYATDPFGQTPGDYYATTEFQGSTVATITGYACACPTPDAPTTPAVVLDPFAGTGTTVLVADQLGRHGIGVDLSADYLRLAEWRVRHDTHTHRKVRDRSGLATPQPPKVDGQLGLFEEPA